MWEGLRVILTMDDQQHTLNLHKAVIALIWFPVTITPGTSPGEGSLQPFHCPLRPHGWKQQPEIPHCPLLAAEENILTHKNCWK